MGCLVLASPGLVQGQLRYIPFVSDGDRACGMPVCLLLTRNQSVAMREVSAPILRMCVDRRGSFSSIRSWGWASGQTGACGTEPWKPPRYPSGRTPETTPTLPTPALVIVTIKTSGREAAHC